MDVLDKHCFSSFQVCKYLLVGMTISLLKKVIVS